MPLAPGVQLGPYTVTAEIGHGGMGVVYRAEDPRLDRHVAIKVLPPDLTRDDTAKQRFLQEAKAASALDHQNICTIHEINETADGQLYLVMAYYEGETLKQRIARGPLKVDDAIDIATQVGQGLAEAHGAGIVHRDIKPANLLVTKSGTVKILDFGLAKLAGSEGVTQTGTTVGTVAYMSPEQARGEEVDHRTDIWSLGVVLHEMLSGQQPFGGENLLAISGAIQQEPPPVLTGESSSLTGVISRALKKGQSQRYPAITDLLADLRSVTGAATQVASQSDVPSIAVLPFTDMSRAGIAFAYLVRGIYGLGAPHDVMPAAKASALEAIASDDTAAEAYLALAGVLHWYEWDWAGAEREYRHALRLNGSITAAHTGLAELLAQVGRFDAAITQANRGIECDPVSLHAQRMLATVMTYAGRWDEAREQARRTLELEASYLPAYYPLATTNMGERRYAEALADCDRGLAYHDADPVLLAWRCHALARLGRRSDAERLLHELLERRSGTHFSAVLIAVGYEALGDTDRALEWLERAVEERDGLCPTLAQYPLFQTAPTDPRFQALLRRMNFPETAASS